MTSDVTSTADLPTVPATPRTSVSPASRTALGALLAAFGTAAALLSMTWFVPGLETLRPWHPGEPIPLVAALVPQTGARVVESENGELVAAPPEVARAAPVTPVAPPAAPASWDVDPATLPDRPPGTKTALVDASHRGMARFYRALHRASRGEGIARAVHWGDSTIAADGISGTVRSRLQSRFGDGGPGFLNAGMDPQWSNRPDIALTREGSWDTKSILHAGAAFPRYGLGGIVTTGSDGATVTFSAPRKGDARVPQHHVEVWYQVNPTSGKWSASAGGKGLGGGSAVATAEGDRYAVKDFPSGVTRVSLSATEGATTFYGVVMETKGPGVVWDALGVVGVGSASFQYNARKHLAAQVAKRRPDLLVIQLGGNELGLGVLSKGAGEGYAPHFGNVVDKLRAGAPEAACLLVTPLDQGTRKGGSVVSKPLLKTLIAQQRAVAAAKGCAFWDAQAAMGGEGAMGRWGARKPPLAWTDLAHLSSDGQAIIGNMLSDAILAGYDRWVASGAAVAVESELAAEIAARASAAPKATTPKPAGTKSTTGAAKKPGTRSTTSKKPAKPKGKASVKAGDAAASQPTSTSAPAGADKTNKRRATSRKAKRAPAGPTAE